MLTVSSKISAVLVTTLVILGGCIQSPEGTVEDFNKATQPTFGGATTRSFTTPSADYILNGECDPLSYAIEWSTNQVTWTEVPGACPAKTFSIRVYLNREITVYVRAKTKFTYTGTSVANITLVLPPTSPYLKLTSSGRTDDSGQEGMQNESSFMTAATLSNAFAIIKSSLVDIIYGD